MVGYIGAQSFSSKRSNYNSNNPQCKVVCQYKVKVKLLFVCRWFYKYHNCLLHLFKWLVLFCQVTDLHTIGSWEETYAGREHRNIPAGLDPRTFKELVLTIMYHCVSSWYFCMFCFSEHVYKLFLYFSKTSQSVLRCCSMSSYHFQMFPKIITRVKVVSPEEKLCKSVLLPLSWISNSPSFGQCVISCSKSLKAKCLLNTTGGKIMVHFRL